MPKDLETEMIVNNRSVPIYFKGDGLKECIKIAPGEGKRVTHILREHHLDVKAFPRHHPSGEYGLNHPREKEFKLTPSMYFRQRIRHEDERFSKDPFYIFMAASIIEMNSIESQINISGVKGKSEEIGAGGVKLHLSDMFDVFKKIKGTPKYWQTAKSELIAKIKQLGSFQLFYTFSCGEMRWSDVFLTLLRRKGLKVQIPADWDGNDATLMVEGIELWDYVNNVMSDKRHELFNEYTFLITIMFNARVDSFIKNILLGSGPNKVPISRYSYRVEFQARGLPHIHGK